MRLGFVALTDAAPVLMAQELGLYAARGVRVELVRHASWPALRDALLSGALDAAHGPASLPLSVLSGLTGGPAERLPIAMVLAAGGQGITLGRPLAGAGYGDPAAAGAVLRGRRLRRPALAVTYPGGTHDVWLRLWLRAAGVDPGEVEVVSIPPPQMVAHLRAGSIQGFSAGEPWHALAVAEGVGVTVLATQDLWRGHPEKALLVNPGYALRSRGELAAAMGAVLAAGAWLDHRPNRRAAARALARRGWLNAPAALVEGRLTGRYALGDGVHAARPPAPVSFHEGGRVNPPRRRDVRWFLAQYERLGLVREARRLVPAAEGLLLRELYAEVAAAEGVPVPDDDLDPFDVALDGTRFDPRAPVAEVAPA